MEVGKEPVGDPGYKASARRARHAWNEQIRDGPRQGKAEHGEQPMGLYRSNDRRPGPQIERAEDGCAVDPRRRREAVRETHRHKTIGDEWHHPALYDRAELGN